MGSLQDFLSKVFDQRGGTWVGLSTATAIFMALTEFVTSGWKPGVEGWHPVAPSWFVAIPMGLFAFILGLFVATKGTNYYMDSRYNSPPDKRPEK